MTPPLPRPHPRRLRPRPDANVELLDGTALVGPFGDYVRIPRQVRP